MAKETERLKNALSRRSGRAYEEDHGAIESGSTSRTMQESRNSSPHSEKDAGTLMKGSRSGSVSIDIGLLSMPVTNLGKELSSIFPRTVDDMEKHVIKSLEAASHASIKEEVHGKPLNFGVVLPGSVYRSSFPQQEDLKYLQSLGLKTILSLVKKDLDPPFETFMKDNGIIHKVVDMQGTKKVDIPEHIMHSIMALALDQENYPLLIHCNHGKHRTGCAVAVIRHVAGWKTEHILEEYRGYAAPKARDCDISYITNYQVASLENLFANNTRQQQKVVGLGTFRNRAKMLRMVFFAAIVLAIWCCTILQHR